MEQEKMYLGDGVYAAVNQHAQIELMTQNGGSLPKHIIYLEPEVLEMLVLFARKNKVLKI